MRLGVAIYHNIVEEHRRASTAGIVDTAERIEQTGFDSIWVADCIGRAGSLIPDPLMLLCAVASATKDIELGTCIVQVPLRHTVEFAHRVLSARLLCGARFLLGVGYGSTRADFDAIGVDFDNRKRLFDIAMPKLRRLLEEGEVEGHNLQPWPLSDQRVSLLLGSWGRDVNIAARDYDGWIGSGHYRSDEQLIQALSKYRLAGGKRAIVVIPGDDEVCSRLERMATAGYDDAVVFPKCYSHKTLTRIRNVIS